MLLIFRIKISSTTFCPSTNVKSKIGLDVTETPRSESFCTHALGRSEPLIVPDALADPMFQNKSMVTGDPGIRFYVGQPIRLLDGSAMGTLCVADTQPRHFSDEDKQALKDLAKLVENELIAIQMATEDELTGLPNRRGFLHQAQTSLNLCSRMGKSSALALLDLTRFKQINDTYGHDEGDQALSQFAGELKNSVRKADIAARLSGDEFVILLSDSTGVEALNCITRFRNRLDQYNATSGKGYRITFNDGVAVSMPGESQSIKTMLGRADQLMYEQKHLGRSRTDSVNDQDSRARNFKPCVIGA